MKIGIGLNDVKPLSERLSLITLEPEKYKSEYPFETFDAIEVRDIASKDDSPWAYVSFEIDDNGVVPRSLFIFSKKCEQAAKKHHQVRKTHNEVKFSNIVQVVAKHYGVKPHEVGMALERDHLLIVEAAEKYNLDYTKTRECLLIGVL